MGAELGRRLAAVDADEGVDRRGEPDLLADLAHDRHRRVLAHVDPTAHEAPAPVVGPFDQQDPVVLVEDRGVGADLGRHVPEVGGQPGPHLLRGSDRAAA